MKKGAYGLTYQEVYLMDNLTIEAKAIYGMLCSYAGAGVEAYPSVEFMCDKLHISRNRFYKHMNLLVGAGVVEKKSIRGKDGVFSSNRYLLVPNCQNIQNPCMENSYMENSYTENEATIINSFKINNFNNNRDARVNYQQIADMYNNTCVSFPRLNKLSESRKKAIKARLKTYGLEDFQKLFEMAEASGFLKGQNDRNWSATFDWLIKDGNMAKVLDGNYQDKEQEKEGTSNVQTEYSGCSVKLWE